VNCLVTVAVPSLSAMRYPGLCLLALPLLSPALRAEYGDRPWEGAQVALPFARHPVPSPALSPGQEQATFRLPPGFAIELVAAEPLVHEPVAAAYDREGNLWAVEFSQFNAGMIRDLPALAAGAKAADVPSCKIVKLESSRHDGHLDRRVVWLEELHGAKGIAVVRDGLLISDPPNLWLARDLHGSGRCDDRRLLLNNYEAWSDPEESGSLLWGRDNIFHDIDFSYDYRYRHGTMERLPVPIRGQFGITQDDYGRLFYCRSMDHLHGDFYNPAYSLRNGNVPQVPWVNAPVARSEEVWPSHPNITNRGYRVGLLGQRMDGVRPDGTLLEFTAACSPLIYRGANFPAEFYGNAFAPEPVGNLVKRDLLQESRGRLEAVAAYHGKEFLTSTDTRFRPVALLNTPDGALLILDMYRGIIEEYHYITSYLRDQSLARGLDKPLFGPGRIWKVTYPGRQREQPSPALDRLSGPELAALLGSPDGWWRDLAQQTLVERGGSDAIPALNGLARQAPNPATRVAALWTLDGLGATTADLLRQALADPSPKVRAAAVRLHEQGLVGPGAGSWLRQLEAVRQDPATEVQVQLALSLGQSPSPAAADALLALVLAARDNPDLPSAVATGLAGREFPFFQRLAAQLDPRDPRPEIADMLKILATALVHAGDPEQVRHLLAAIGAGSSLPRWARLKLLDGCEPLLTPAFRRSVGPRRLLHAAALDPLAALADAEIGGAARTLQQGLAREEEKTRQREAKVRPLTADELGRYEQGKATFQICAACHQPGGTGLPNVAPSLVDSRWASSYPEIMIRIILCGKEGTPGFSASMPPIGGTLSDQQIAGVVTYVRNSWGLHEGAVDAATVARVRAAVGDRQAAWHDAELRRVEGSIALLGQDTFAARPRR